MQGPMQDRILNGLRQRMACDTLETGDLHAALLGGGNA